MAKSHNEDQGGGLWSLLLRRVWLRRALTQTFLVFLVERIKLPGDGKRDHKNDGPAKARGWWADDDGSQRTKRR
ncbi:MAG: hypothetical protein IPH08_00020 [Rhodocyclaceae bacterium]|nr:hypothetical protein [Rhodocyclaceae bacterium]